MKKLLITGGNGFLGSRIKKRFRNQFDITSVEREDFDICDREQAFKFFDSCRPDLVIHGAAQAATAFCDKYPEIAHNINVQGAVNIAEACKKHNSKLIFFSSEQIFNGNKEKGPYNEDTTPFPDTVYGKTKLEAEARLKEVLNGELWIIRLAWMFGMPEINCGMAENILWGTVKSIIRSEKIHVSPNEFRSVTYVEEMVANIRKVFDIPYDTYHFSAKNDLNRYDTTRFILNEMGALNAIENLLVRDDEKYKDSVRDARICSVKTDKVGVYFTDSLTALKQCINEYNLNLK